MSWIFATCPIANCKHSDLFWGSSSAPKLEQQLRDSATEQLKQLHETHKITLAKKVKA